MYNKLSDIKNYDRGITNHDNTMKNIVANNHLGKISLNNRVLQKSHFFFNHRLDKKELGVSDQSQSGRCWIYSFTNMIQRHMLNKYEIEKFDISHIYITFWDKFEKCHTFLKRIEENKKLPLKHRIMYNLLKKPIDDGGQWSMIVNVVNKYGIIPKSSMKETYHSKHTEYINYILNLKLRQYAHKLRNTKIKGKTIYYMMKNIYRLLVYFFGHPPKKINWSYVLKDKNKKDKKGKKGKHKKKDYVGNNDDTDDDTDEDDNEEDDTHADEDDDHKSKHKKGKQTQKNKKKDKKVNQKNNKKKTRKNKKNQRKYVYGVSPNEFYEKYVEFDVNDYILLMNAPNRDYYTKYRIKYNTNMYKEGIETDYVNVPIELIKKATRDSITKKEPVWFSCDFVQQNSHKNSLLYDNVFNFEDVLNTTLFLDKRQALLYKQVEVNHAMLMIGYHKQKNKITKWLVENSHGKQGSNEKGEYYMNDKWFDKFVFEIVIHSKYVDNKVKKALKTKPKILPMWDPFGDVL
uniref:Peptidase C1-like family protein n=1 Tax=Megaviridae environmental sample TaxID=1737588 RepID=A0A5J6VN76_9VIRU|nr:MAG: peptidase C1-like family protein [Megaviridae environmental sample]